MPKKQKRPPKTSENWLKYGLLTTLGLVVVGLVAFWGYQNYADKTDAARFAALQSDFKKLQAEFNTIDPGWKYSEGCTAGGLLDDFKTCSVSVSNDSIKESDIKKVSNSYEVAIAHAGSLRKGRQSSFTHETKRYVETILVSDEMKDASCDLLVQRENLASRSSASIGCSADAHDFYFKRLDR